MMKKISTVTLITAILLLTSCYKINEISIIDNTNNYNSTKNVSSYTKNRFNSYYIRSGAYIKLNNHSFLDNEYYKDIVTSNFNKYKFFNKIVATPKSISIGNSYKTIITANNKLWFNLDDQYTIHKLKKIYPHYLIIDSTLMNLSPLSNARLYGYLIRLIDSKSGNIIASFRSQSEESPELLIQNVIYHANNWLIKQLHAPTRYRKNIYKNFKS